MEDILNFLEKAKNELDSIEYSGEKLEKLSKEKDEIYKEAVAKARMLSDKRKETALNFEKNVLKELTFLDDPEANVAETLESDQWFDGDETDIMLQKAIQTLPEKQHLVFNMKYYQDMKYEEISQILDTSVGALKASYHFAIEKIEKYFKDND